jgi:hypothetical protein
MSYFVREIGTALITFNRMRWFRSRNGPNGLFEPATGPLPQPATLSGRLSEPHSLNGKTLSFRINGVTQVDVTFPGADPTTTSYVISRIAAATGLITATSSAGKLVLSTVLNGSLASLEILESDGAAFLGFDTGQAAVGIDQDVILSSGVHEYFYTDQNGSPEYYYKSQLLNSVTAVVSNASAPLSGEYFRTIAAANTVTAYIYLMGMNGRPLAGRIVHITNPVLPNALVVDGTRYGMFRHALNMTTDRDGYAEVRLVRGMEVDFAVDGTNLIRRIQVPTTGDGFDLLDPSLVVSDEFGIQEPKIDFMVRTT